ESRLVGDWRRWVLREYGGIETDRPPVAAAARLATDSALRSDSRRSWLATPLHLEGGLTEGRMASELPGLDAGEWDALISGFNNQFEADGVTLKKMRGGFALVEADSGHDAFTVDPLRVLGQSVEPALPGGPDAAPLRRLMTEVQMWLHDHP